MGNEEMRNF